MKHHFSCGILFSFLILCSACSSLSVRTDYDPTFDFTQLRSYAWLESGKGVSKDARVNNDLMVNAVRVAVEENLAKRGFVKGNMASADFVVSWLGAIDTKLQNDTIDHFYSSYGYGPLHRGSSWNDSGAPVVAVNEYEVGTIMVDILDPVQHKLLWRGTGQGRIKKDEKPEGVTLSINEAVSAIMKDFPVAEKY